MDGLQPITRSLHAKPGIFHQLLQGIAHRKGVINHQHARQLRPLLGLVRGWARRHGGGARRLPALEHLSQIQMHGNAAVSQNGKPRNTPHMPGIPARVFHQQFPGVNQTIHRKHEQSVLHMRDDGVIFFQRLIGIYR